jgi:hypothetical protein
MAKPSYNVRVSVDERTGRLLAVCFRVREGGSPAHGRSIDQRHDITPVTKKLTSDIDNGHPRESSLLPRRRGKVD